MQDAPDKVTLLKAVASFLGRDLKGAVSDPALAYRLLVASSMVQMVATEVATEDHQDAAELERLRLLLPDLMSGIPGGAGRAQRHEAIRALNQELATRLRQDLFDDEAAAEVRAHLEQTLREKLAVVNPRFDADAELD